MKTNAKIYNDNIATMKAVNAGEVDGGIIYHYYWFRDQANTKESSGNTALHYFKNQDPGAFVSLSGGGVLESSKKQEQAQQFLKFITGKAGQEVLENGTSFEYPVASGVPANPALPPLDSLQAPNVDPSTLNAPKVTDLMTKAGSAVGGRSPSFAPSGAGIAAEPDRAPRPARLARRSRSWSPPRASRSATSCGRRCRSGWTTRLRARGPAAGRRAAGQHRRAGGRHGAALRRARRRRGLAGRAHRPAGP